jgi:ribosomal protein S12
MPVTHPRSTPRWTIGTPLMTRRGRVVVLASACLVSATLALVQFQPPPAQQGPAPAHELQLAAAPEPAPTQLTAKTRVARPAVNTKTPVARPAVTRAVATTSRRPATASRTVAASATSDAATVAAPAPRERQDAIAPSIITISGCLERDDERFRLRDTAGNSAPTERSWRSGFLRRGTSTIDVIDEADRHHLPTYVGQRVSVTGRLVDREMQVRSVSIVAESCEEKSA